MTFKVRNSAAAGALVIRSRKSIGGKWKLSAFSWKANDYQKRKNERLRDNLHDLDSFKDTVICQQAYAMKRNPTSMIDRLPSVMMAVCVCVKLTSRDSIMLQNICWLYSFFIVKANDASYQSRLGNDAAQYGVSLSYMGSGMQAFPAFRSIQCHRRALWWLTYLVSYML